MFIAIKKSIERKFEFQKSFYFVLIFCIKNSKLIVSKYYGEISILDMKIAKCYLNMVDSGSNSNLLMLCNHKFFIPFHIHGCF